jgi:hypothetical protein
VNTLGVRILALGTLILILAGCSASSGVPSNASAPASNTAARLNHGPCPASGISFGPGDNGTWTVADGSDCIMYVPPDTPCATAGVGDTYTVLFTGGSTHGTLTHNEGNKWTFKRTSTGEGDLELQQAQSSYFNHCKPEFSSYGTLTFTTP